MPDYIWFFAGLAVGLLGAVLALVFVGGRRQFDDSDLRTAYYDGYTDRGELDGPNPPK